LHSLRSATFFTSLTTPQKLLHHEQHAGMEHSMLGYIYDRMSEQQHDILENWYTDSQANE